MSNSRPCGVTKAEPIPMAQIRVNTLRTLFIMIIFGVVDCAREILWPIRQLHCKMMNSECGKIVHIAALSAQPMWMATCVIPPFRPGAARARATRPTSSSVLTHAPARSSEADRMTHARLCSSGRCVDDRPSSGSSRRVIQLNAGELVSWRKRTRASQACTLIA